MTLRRQFHLLLAAVVVLPILCVSLVPLYHWTHTLTKEVLSVKEDHGKEHKEEEPYRDEAEGKDKKDKKDDDDRKDKKKKDKNKKDKMPSYMPHGKKWRSMLLARLYIPISVFIVVLVISIIHISRTIFSSIQVLAGKASLIADGNLNVTLIDDTGDGVATRRPHSRSRQTNEIIALTNNLERMRQSLSDFNERRTRFIMGISHDLRTPVAVIKGYAEAITDGVMSTPDEVANAADIINAKAGQLASMIDALISFVKLDSRDWRQSLESVPLKAVLEDFAREAVSTGTVFNRNVTSDIQISGNITVQMDRQMFVRALENIFSNAIRYSAGGDSINITAQSEVYADKTAANRSDAEGRDKTAVHRQGVCVAISDTGHGIEEAELNRIFDMFQRGTHSRREDGMGIGLAVVKSVAEAHGWSITVKSKVGEGTEFAIHIPVTSG